MKILNKDYGEELHRIASSLSEEEQQELLKEYQHVFQKYNGKKERTIVIKGKTELNEDEIKDLKTKKA